MAEVFAMVRTIQALRKASTARLEKDKAQAPQGDAQADESDTGRTCKTHGVPMIRAISRRTSKPYFSHVLVDGIRCFGRSKA